MMMPNELSEKASRVLSQMYSRFRANPAAIPDYATLAADLCSSITEIDEAATELSVLGYIQIVSTWGDHGNCGVLILDEGKLAATRIRDVTLLTPGLPGAVPTEHKLSRSSRFFQWVLDHIVLKTIAAIIVGLLLVWLGLR